MKAPLIRVYLDKEGTDEVSGWVTSFDFEDSTEKDNKLVLRIHQDRVNDMLDKPAIRDRGMVYFKWGYMEGPTSELQQGKISDVNVTYGNTIDLELVILDRGNAMKKGASKQVWKGLTTRQIATQLAERNGLTLEMPFEGKKWDDVPQAGKSDMKLLQYLVGREKGGKYITYVRNSTLYVVERGTAKPSSVTLTYKKDPELVSLRVRWVEKSAKGAVNAAEVSGNDTPAQTADARAGQTDTTLDKYRVLINAAGEAVATTAGGFARSMTDPYGEVNKSDPKQRTRPVGTKTAQPTKDVEEAKAMAHKRNNRAAIRVLQVTLEMWGNPLILPDQVITLAGVHTSHEGNWYVHSVRHSIRAGERYMSTLELGRNAARRNDGNNSTEATKKNNTVGPNEVSTNVSNLVIDAMGNLLSRQDTNSSSAP